MLETSARLLRLLALLQARRDWTGSALADRLDVSERTVRRDVDRLRDLGYPVHASRGTDGGYRLGAGAAMPPLLLDDEEAVAVPAAPTGGRPAALHRRGAARQSRPHGRRLGADGADRGLPRPRADPVRLPV